MPEYSDEQIRVYAYRLWEKSNNSKESPEDFWHQAKNELESDAPGDKASKSTLEESPKPMPE